VAHRARGRAADGALLCRDAGCGGALRPCASGRELARPRAQGVACGRAAAAWHDDQARPWAEAGVGGGSSLEDMAPPRGGGQHAAALGRAQSGPPWQADRGRGARPATGREPGRLVARWQRGRRSPGGAEAARGGPDGLKPHATRRTCATVCSRVVVARSGAREHVLGCCDGRRRDGAPP